MVWYSELARRILPRPTPTPAGDKPPRYIFSFRHRPSVYNSARFAGGVPASRLIGGHIFVRMTRLGRPARLEGYYRLRVAGGEGVHVGEDEVAGSAGKAVASVNADIMRPDLC